MNQTLETTTHRRRLKGCDDLVISVIKQQAGTLDKALLEGVMNSVDAGATKVAITLTHDRVRIEDDGKGILQRQEIEDFFETFGTKHNEGDARFGKFRMGRGQMFSYGKNVWRTGPFSMMIDIDSMGLDYDLTEGMEMADGCQVDIALYELLSPRNIYEVSQEMQKMVKYLDIPVYLNDERISNDPSTMRFPDSTDDAYIQLNSARSTIEVYNQGVFVQSIGSYQYGMGGVVVTKKQIAVNFARNQVMDKCPIWRRIRTIFNQEGEKRVTKKLTLNGHERVNALKRLVAGDITSTELQRTQILEDINAKGWSPAMVIKAGFANFTVADARDEKARMLQESGQAFVLARHIADLFGCPYQEIFIKYDFDTYRGGKMPTYAPMDLIEFDAESAKAIVLPRDKWKPKERVWVAIMGRMLGDARHHVDTMTRGIAQEEIVEAGTPRDWQTQNRRVRELLDEFGLNEMDRKIVIGTSKSIASWTDGRTYIAFSREFVASLQVMFKGSAFVRDHAHVAGILLKQALYDVDSRNAEFDEADQKLFCDLAPRAIADMVSHSVSYLTPARYVDLLERSKRASKDIEDDPEVEPEE